MERVFGRIQRLDALWFEELPVLAESGPGLPAHVVSWIIFVRIQESDEFGFAFLGAAMSWLEALDGGCESTPLVVDIVSRREGRQVPN